MQAETLARLTDLLERTGDKPEPPKTTPAAKPRTTKATPKLKAAIQYLRDNPDAVSLSSRKLAEIEIDGMCLSHVIWNNAKKAL